MIISLVATRKCEAGEWFFHGSGVDISFASNVEFQNGKAKLSDNLFFGEILLRGIKRFNENNKLSDNAVNGIILKDKPSKEFKDFFDELIGLFDKFGIAWGVLSGTKDIWLRDFMPV
ncbi:MAG: hypothetical protein MR658_00110 [Campylobacter sp.]|uniref:hypothetical protein n=1 Tax=Campylobacter sp. TaxID=205 RepID=UPI002AA7FE23|nr:hypothetical protein [Campylobacter sp.]MCI6177230.1 hypothetical protein [Campylobacter sp.]